MNKGRSMGQGGREWLVPQLEPWNVLEAAGGWQLSPPVLSGRQQRGGARGPFLPEPPAWAWRHPRGRKTQCPMGQGLPLEFLWDLDANATGSGLDGARDAP